MLTSVAHANHARDSPDGSSSRSTSRAARRAPRERLLRPSAVPVRRSLEVGRDSSPLEQDAEQIARTGLSKARPSAEGTTAMTAPRIVHAVLGEAGVPLDDASREFFEQHFRQDFSMVRLHTGRAAAASARSIHAEAYAAGDHVVLREQQRTPGRGLLAHELAHVAQDRERGEVRAVHRRVEMRDVGRGEASGFARLPELIDRLNGVADGLIFHLDDNNDLQYSENPYGTPTEFERRMQAFIDSGTPIRLRITNKSGLLPGDTGKFTETVNVDDYESGYVDIDDLLAADDLALQTLLVHFLTERAATKDYSRRIGGQFTEEEFAHGHQAGIDAETQVVRDFFKDNTIRFADEPTTSTGLRRLWTNSRGDSIRAPFRSSGGVEAWSIQVRLRDGRTMTATEYRDFLASVRGANPAP